MNNFFLMEKKKTQQGRHRAGDKTKTHKNNACWGTPAQAGIVT
jgi:hypothetical protein